MKPRNLTILIAALVLISILLALAAVLYSGFQGGPPFSDDTVTEIVTVPTKSGSTQLRTASTVVPPLITPTPTLTPPPTPSPSPTPTAVPSPTVTPTPSPTPLPAARLANAHRAKRYGDFQQARSELRALLEAPGAAADRVEVAYQSGVVAQLDGDYQSARDLLSAFIRDYPDHPHVGTAHFFLAEALTAVNAHAEAIEHYRAYLQTQDTLADMVYTQIGDSYMQLVNYEGAVDAYQVALEKALDLGQQYDLREKIALAYASWARYDEAISWFQGIVERSENVYRLARIWYLMGQTHRMAGKEEQALEAFAKAVDGDPRPGFAYAALVALVDAGFEVNEYKRGLIDYYAKSYNAAVAAFYRYMEGTANYDSDAHYYAALSYLGSGSFDLAAEECERALSKFPDTIPHWGELWLTKGRALAGSGRVDDAVATFVTFADHYPDQALAPQAQWEAAALLEEARRFPEAADVYAALADAHVHAERAPAARFRAGLSRYRAGDREAAVRAWRELANGYPHSPESLQGRYWLGRTLWSEGQVDQARIVLETLATQHPRDYYGLRAADLVAANGQVLNWPKVSTALHLTSDDDREQEEAAAWLRSWSGAPEGTDLTKVSPALADDVRFRRGMESLALEQRTQATEAFDELRKELAQDPLSLYQLAHLTRDLGLYAPSMRATISLIALAPESSVLDMPRSIQRLAFPVYFADLVIAECDTYGIDPLLMFSLIRQESVFDDQVSSWAGAVGLSQVMPSTGEWIAQTMPWPEYHEGLLKRAYLNVKFGTWYLARTLDMTEGDILAALAGYNGGPGNGVRWQEEARGDPDLYLEVIDRAEPRQYVREIYRHYDVYARLYTGE